MAHIMNVIIFTFTTHYSPLTTHYSYLNILSPGKIE